MDMDLILTLDALLRDQNITHAAARLGISQPAMSACPARLRVLFGEPLFVPSHTDVGVTDAARRSVKAAGRDGFAGHSGDA